MSRQTRKDLLTISLILLMISIAVSRQDYMHAAWLCVGGYCAFLERKLKF